MSLEDLLNSGLLSGSSLDISSAFPSLIPDTTTLITWTIVLVIVTLLFLLLFRGSYNRYNKSNQKIKLLKQSNALLQEQLRVQQQILKKLSLQESSSLPEEIASLETPTIATE